ncbi:MAG: hypothetical protein RLZZ70_608 [Candidatus Parcubacteria bacterium]|jgi:hypothetical protein
MIGNPDLKGGHYAEIKNSPLARGHDLSDLWQ